MVPRMTPHPAWKGTFTTATFNHYRYKIYTPTGYRPDTQAMLLVMLHGCTQSPDDFATVTEMNNYAEQHTFIVIYPAQSTTANPARCWNWFQPKHQARGSGEPATIVGIVEQVMHTYTIDPTRVYVAGISAGGSMSVILGATYPDIFAAIGVCSGMPYRAATSITGAMLAQSRGGPDPQQQGRAAYLAMGEYHRVVPIVIFHGTADLTVAPINADHLVTQWLQTNQLAADGFAPAAVDITPASTLHVDNTDGKRSYTEEQYADEHGRTIVKKYLVQGMQHCWPGGPAGMAYADPQAPHASTLMLDFFAQHTLKEAWEPVAPLPPTRHKPVPTLDIEATESAPEPAEQPALLARLGTSVRKVGNRIMHELRRLWKG